MGSFRFLGIISASALVLSGCAASPSLFEFSQPPNICQGSDIYLEVSNDRPEFSSGTQDSFTLSVVDRSGQPVSVLDLGRIAIEYRIGFFEETGFEEISTESFSVRSPYNVDFDLDPVASPNPNPSPLPSEDAFLDVFWDTAGPTPSLEANPDGSVFGAVSMDGPVKSGDLSDFFGGEGEEEGGLLEGIFALPGAFMAKCLETDEYVAAVRVFPNTSVDPMSPQVTVGDQIRLDFSESLLGYTGFILGAISPIQNETFSSDEITNRWLNSVSFTLEEIVEGGLTRGIELLHSSESDPTFDEIDPLATGTYWVTISYALASVGQDVPDTYKLGTAYYNLEVTDGGAYNFVPQYFEPVRSGRASPALEFPTGGLSVSTKGKKQVLLSGTNLASVNSVSVGGKNAKILSSSQSQLLVSFPSLPAGSHKVSLKHGTGQLNDVGTVTYAPAEKLGRFLLPQPASKRALTRIAKSKLRSTPGVVQVDCVVNLASGERASSLRRKAAHVCAALASNNPNLKTVVRTVVGGSISQKSFTLATWG